jgi:hypothetical protein
MNTTRLTLAVLVAVGLAATIANADLPVVRNSLVYARMVDAIEDRNLAAWEVCSDPDQAKKQGCGFAMMAVPIVRAVGMNVGLKVASFIGTALFLAALVVFFRRFNARFGLDDRDVPLELAATCFNPLIIYQFWSAYPDTLFAALYLTSFVLADKLVRDPAPRVGRLAAAFVAVVALAVVVKPAGLILFPLHALFAVWHHARLAELARREPRRVAILAASAVVLVGWVALGKLGWNPFLNINGGEYDRPVAYLDSVKGVVILWAIVFGALLVFAVPRLSMTRTDAIVLVLLAAHVHIIMVFHAASFNLRHYLPAIAFATPYVVRALRRTRRPRLASGAIAVFFATNAAAIAAFNIPGANRSLADSVPASVLADYGYLDNLRLAAQRRVGDALATINRELPPNAELLYVSSYYGDGADGIYERAGLLRSDLRVVYSSSLRGTKPGPDAWIFLADAVSGAPPVEGAPVRWLFRANAPRTGAAATTPAPASCADAPPPADPAARGTCGG